MATRVLAVRAWLPKAPDSWSKFTFGALGVDCVVTLNDVGGPSRARPNCHVVVSRADKCLHRLAPDRWMLGRPDLTGLRWSADQCGVASSPGDLDAEPARFLIQCSSAGRGQTHRRRINGNWAICDPAGW